MVYDDGQREQERKLLRNVDPFRNLGFGPGRGTGSGRRCARPNLSLPPGARSMLVAPATYSESPIPLK